MKNRQKAAVLTAIIIPFMLNHSTVCKPPRASFISIKRISCPVNQWIAQAAINHAQQVKCIAAQKLTPPKLKQVSYQQLYRMDLRTAGGFSGKQLNTVLLYRLRGLGHYYAQAADQKGVNSIFLIAVAAEESGWGRYPLPISRYNVYSDYGYQPFSYVECIEHIAALIRQQYLTAKGKYFHGYRVCSINVDYCLTKSGTTKWSWTREVVHIMVDMYNQIYQQQYKQEVKQYEQARKNTDIH